MWKLTYAVDSLDPDPMVKSFEEFTELTEWLDDSARYLGALIIVLSLYLISEKLKRP